MFGLPVPLFTLLDRLFFPFCTGASSGLGCMCPNHTKWFCTSFSTSVTPNLSCMWSLRTRSQVATNPLYLCVSATVNFTSSTQLGILFEQKIRLNNLVSQTTATSPSNLHTTLETILAQCLASFHSFHQDLEEPTCYELLTDRHATDHCT